MIVGDLNEERLAQARSFGCETVDVSKGDPKDQIEQILGVPEVDCGGRRRRLRGPRARHGRGHEAPATVLNSLMERHRARAARSASPACTSPATRAASTRPPRSARCRSGSGSGWAKSLSFTTGQCPVMQYNRQLMMAILHDKVQIAKAVNATAISLDDAPQGYAEFDQGAATKYVLNPNGYLGASAASGDPAIELDPAIDLSKSR